MTSRNLDTESTSNSGSITHTIEGFMESNSNGKSSSIKSVSLQDKDMSREAFYVQAFLIYVICITCIVNLSIGSEHSDVFISLLSGSLGVLLPSPRILRPKKNKLFDFSVDNKSEI